MTGRQPWEGKGGEGKFLYGNLTALSVRFSVPELAGILNTGYTINTKQGHRLPTMTP